MLPSFVSPRLPSRLIALALAAPCMALMSVSPGSAATIAGVTIYGASSTNFDRYPVNVINGSGLNASTGAHSNDPSTMWQINSSPSVADSQPYITLDLGAVYDLNAMRVWNYNENYNAEGVPSGIYSGTHTGSGVKLARISIASSLNGPFVSLGTFTFNQSTGSSVNDISQIVDLSAYAAADSARLVRLDILSSWWQGRADPTSYAGLSELQFSGVAVPEPSHLFLSAMAGASLILRRRRL